jgi:hypothetical protein
MTDDARNPDAPARPGSARLFQRREAKYEVGVATATFLREEIARHLTCFEFEPGHPTTWVTTIYFDTKARDLYRRAERHYDENVKIRVKEYYYPLNAGPEGREEYRTSPHCYVEIKEHANGSVIKRRFRFPKSELSRLMRGEDLLPLLTKASPPEEIDHLGEVYGEFRRLMGLHHVEATSVVTYRRTVYQESEDDLRITFDDHFAVWAPYHRLYDGIDALTPGVLGKPVRVTDKVILEIKCPGDYPHWLEKALRNHSTKPLSKFTTSVRLLLGGEEPDQASRRQLGSRNGSEGDTQVLADKFH